MSISTTDLSRVHCIPLLANNRTLPKTVLSLAARVEVRRGIIGRREKFAAEWAKKTDIKNQMWEET